MRRSPLRSPPRVRGKDGGNHQRTAASRITPAYAGKSDLRSTLLPDLRDHPRVCGEKKGVE